MKKQEKTSHVYIFFKTMFISLIILLSIIVGTYFVCEYFFSKDDDSQVTQNRPEEKDGNFLSNFIRIPDKTSFAVLGTDKEGSRADFIMVGSYNNKDGTIDLISIPRDTMVTMPPDKVNALKEQGFYVPTDGVMKICEVYHFAGKKDGLSYTVEQLKDELGLNLDYYTLINLDAFNYIITEMGGIEFYVPQRMYYNDPAQNLYIDLQPGLQTLNAEQAEGLVRYRKSDPINPISKGYLNDETRMKVQQDFIKSMASQLMQKENIVGNAKTILSTFFQYIETNLTVSDALKYAKVAKNFDIQNINTHILPSAEKRIGNKSYQVLVEEEKDRIIDEVFFKTEENEKTEESSKNKDIEILNGGYTDGLASKKKTELEKEGYTVVSIDDYSGEKQEKTRIIVKKDGQGADLAQYFNESIIKVNLKYETGNDIVIILGTREK